MGKQGAKNEVREMHIDKFRFFFNILSFEMVDGFIVFIILTYN